MTGDRPKTVLLLGATGTIGRATARALVAKGHPVTVLVRPGAEIAGLPAELKVHSGGLDLQTLEQVMRDSGAQAVVSCLASRTGVAADAQAIDHRANSDALKAALANGVTQYVLLSAICVQKPRLAFQQAKLAFEAELQAAEVTWSIVRPTAFFKSLSGQVDRLRSGKPFLLFGDGQLTRCKPISDRDTALYLTCCLSDPALQNCILPIGGPGPAISPREQGELLFKALKLRPRFKHIPVGIMSAIIGGLGILGLVSVKLREKAELARIGRYYATESMLVWNPQAQCYDADATPEFGSDTLADHYHRLADGDTSDDRGTHAVF